MKKTKVKPKILFSGIFIVLLFYFLTSAVLVYGFNLQNNWLRVSARWMPYPAALVNFSHPIMYQELQDNLSAVKNFYEKQDLSNSGLRVDFSTEGGEKRLKIKEKYLLNKLIENKIMALLAKEKNLEVTPQMIREEIEKVKLQSQFSETDEGLEKLSQLYGWTLKDLEEKIIQPQILGKKLEEASRQEETQFLVPRNKIEKAQQELNQGLSFEEVANEYSEGESSKNEGELGWFPADQMIPEIALTCFSLEKGDISQIIESPLGFHLIKLEDKKIEEGVEKYKIKQVFVRTPTFAQWFLEKQKDFQVQILLKDYYWDKERQVVEFRDPALREFEEYLRNNFSGDLSVLF